MAMKVWFRVTQDDATRHDPTKFYKLERCAIIEDKITAHVVGWYNKDEYLKATRVAFEKNSHVYYARSLTAQPGG